MTEEEWSNRLLNSPDWAVESLYYKRTIPDRKFRLLSCACCRLLVDYLPTQLAELLVATEGYCDGSVIEKELRRKHSSSHPFALDEEVVSAELLEAVRQAAGPPYSYEEWDEIHESDSRPPTSNVMTSLSLASYEIAGTASIEAMRAKDDEYRRLTEDIFGNPFRPVVFDPRWRSESAVALARTAYDTRDFALLPILADALEEAGCDHADVLAHCRDPNGVHVRGCWVVDGVLGKQ